MRREDFDEAAKDIAEDAVGDIPGTRLELEAELPDSVEGLLEKPSGITVDEVEAVEDLSLDSLLSRTPLEKYLD